MTFSCESLNCSRGGVNLLEGLGFCLPTGGFLLLKGANGSGKTTLMKTLAGLLPAEAGRITWKDQDIRRSPEFHHALTYIGHTNALKRELSVLENVLFWAKAYGREPFITPALRYFSLEGKEYLRVGSLSAGWQRRVALTRLLLSPRPLWLLDEPTNFLDQEAIALVGSLIESRVTTGGIVIAASHTMGSSFATHVLQLEDFAP